MRKTEARLRAVDSKLNVAFFTPSEIPPTVFYPCGIGAVDEFLGGGLPAGRIIELYGPEAIGKTTLALQFKPEVFVDVERTAESRWFDKFSPETEVICQKKGERMASEDVWDVLAAAAQANVRLVVVDSLGAMVSKSQLADREGYAPLARDVSRNLRRLIPMLDKTTILFINQVRMVVGSSIPNLMTSPGGKFFLHVCTQRVEMKWCGQWIKYSEAKVGHGARLYLRKNKVGRCEYDTTIYLGYEMGFFETEDALKKAYRDLRKIRATA